MSNLVKTNVSNMITECFEYQDWVWRTYKSMDYSNQTYQLAYISYLNDNND